VRMGASRAEGLEDARNLQLAAHLYLSRLPCLGKFHLTTSASNMMPKIVADSTPSDCAAKLPTVMDINMESKQPGTSGIGRTAPDESVLSEAEVSEDVCDGTATDSASDSSGLHSSDRASDLEDFIDLSEEHNTFGFLHHVLPSQTSEASLPSISSYRSKQKKETKKLDKLVAQKSKQNMESKLGLIADAPEGHVAFKKVTFKKVKNGAPCVVFQFPVNGERVQFQTTTRACGDSREIAEKIARLCYLKFETGASKEEVFRYRDALYRIVAKGINSCDDGETANNADSPTMSQRVRALCAARIVPDWQDQCRGLLKTHDFPSPSPSPTLSPGQHAPKNLICEHAQRWCAQVVGMPLA